MTNEEAIKEIQDDSDYEVRHGSHYTLGQNDIISKIDNMETVPAVLLDRVKRAREEVANYSDFHREHLYKTNPNYDVEQGQYLAYEKCLKILDELIAESEGEE